MKRLTDKAWGNLDPWECCGQDYYCQRGCHDVGGCTKGCIVPMLYTRLARYEDTGLEPERVAELAQAEKDGRLVVLPTHGRWMPFHSKIAGDIQYCSVCEIGFEERTDFCPHCGAKMDLPEAALKKREEEDDEPN